jgi:predicted dehydrogenase
MSKKKTDTYGLTAAGGAGSFAAPELPYLPPVPRKYRPKIGLITCGGITQSHLTAYRKQGYNVVALCDLDIGRAEKRRAEFYPEATVYTDFREVLKRPDIDVVDVATHPAERAAILPECLKARKHVLSQKPFVLDLRLGAKLVDLAEKYNVKLAVNQNGRWAPHVSYMRQAVNKGLIGDVLSAHMAVHWNHDWVAGSPFDKVRYLILYDFAIHWFDMVHCYMRGKTATRVYASDRVGQGQKAKPPLFGQAQIEFADAQASLVFDGYVLHGAKDRTYIAGTKGTLSSDGPDLISQTVTLTTAKGTASPKLEGKWFPDGMAGTMGELLAAIEAKRQPSNSAADNLKSLAVCFAACKSAETGKPQVPGKVLTLVK